VRDGAHRGGRHPLRDSSCSLPPITLAGSHLAEVRRYTEAIARGVGVRGLLNVQYALKDDTLYVLEANPRASRTVPFVSKATAVPLAKAAARIMLGATSPSCVPRDCCWPTATAAPPPSTRRSRSRRRCAFQAVPHPAGKGVTACSAPT